MENTPHKKRFSEEETLDKMEKKIDQKMNKVMNQSFVRKFLNLKIMKDILNSHMVNDVVRKLHPSLKTLFIVVGWISLIS